MAIERAATSPQAPVFQPPAPGVAAATPTVAEAPAARVVDAAAIAPDRPPTLATDARPELPPVNVSALDGQTEQEAYAAVGGKFAETPAPAERFEKASRLRAANAPARTAAIMQAAGNVTDKLLTGLLKTVASNPIAAARLVLVTATQITGVIASGGTTALPAIGLIAAAAAPIVSGTLARSGLELDRMLASGIQDVLVMTGVDKESAWKAAEVGAAAIFTGISIGAAVAARDPSAFDVNTLGALTKSVANAFEMKRSSAETIANMVQGFGSLGLLVGGSIASGADVLKYGGLDKILSGGADTFGTIMESFKDGITLKELNAAGSDLVKQLPELQKFFEQAYADLESNGNLITALGDSYDAIVEYVKDNAALARYGLDLRRNQS